jgi:hypothetical protein
MASKRPSGVGPHGGRRKLLPSVLKGVGVLLTLGYLCFVSFYSSRSSSAPGTQEASSDYQSLMTAKAPEGELGSTGSIAPPVPVVAYVISVTADGPYMDGAAVLAFSIRKAAKRSKYGHELIAIIYPDVTKSRTPLERAGWR